MAANSVALYWIIISIGNFAVVIFRCLFYNLGMVWYIVEKGEGGLTTPLDVSDNTHAKKSAFSKYMEFRTPRHIIKIMEELMDSKADDVKSVRMLIYSRNKYIDLFPRTSAVVKMAILRSKKPLISSRERTG